jgi:glycosyltransferase involved in cell wall biosynthesis
VQGVTGDIISATDPLAMARRMLHLVHEPDQARLKGLAGRQRVESQFSMQAMVTNYQRVYDEQLRRIGAVNG